MNANWYDVLDVDPSASADEIRSAWKAAVADLDPTDRRFRVYNQAAEVLLDPARRSSYDAELAAETEDQTPAERHVAATTAEPAPDLAAAEVEPVPRPAGPDGEQESRGHGWTPGWLVPGWLLIGLAVLTAAALVVVGVLLTKPSAASQESDASAAQAAAERAIVPILSYDAHHLGQSEAQATPYLTTGEKDQYDKLFAVIRQNAPRTGTVVKAKYVASGIVRTGSGRVDVLVFVNQATTNKQHPKTPVVYKNQVTVSMEKVGNDWLVDNLVTGTASR